MENFWDFIWLMFWTYLFVAVIVFLFRIFADVFRDQALNGWAKALWVVFIIIAPFLGGLIYLIARRQGMTDRDIARSVQAREETAAYIRATAGTSYQPPAEEITQGKALYDSGAITRAEFDTIKDKALSRA